MPIHKSSFLDRVLGRINRLDSHGLQSIIERLARERNFLETLFNIIEDGVLVVDEAGRIIYFNQSVTQLLGSHAEIAEGRHISKYFPELDWRKLAAMDAAGGRQVMRHEFEVQLPRPRFLRVYAAPLDGESTGSSGVALILHDATEARAKTREAIETERTEALTLLAASVAHEIGNPLNALHIHLQLIERELKKLRTPPPAGARPARKPAPGPGSAPPESLERLDQYVSVAKGEIGRLDYIISQFLHAIRPSRIQLQLGFLNDAVNDTLELLRPEIENRGQTINLKLAPALPACPLDRQQMKQALVNVIKNAMQAMTRGGVLTLQTGSSHDLAWVSVGDTGGGIPQDTINRIFEPFYTTKKKGSGLGLMIVQRIVRDHNGRIDIESRVGEGTVFRICLPLHERAPRLLEARLHD